MNTMRLYNPEFAYIYSFSDFVQFQMVLKYYGKSNLAIAVNASSGAAHFLQPDHIIDVDYNGTSYPFIIKRIVLDNDILTVQAVSPHELFERRITIPPDGSYAVTGSGTPDKVVKDFIRGCISGGRSLPVRVAADQTDGARISDTSRLKNLGDEVSRVCAAHGIGEVFTLDTVNGVFVFDTFSGADRTSSNTDNNAPCVFAEKYKNLVDHKYDYDTSGIVTTAIVAGAGEGEEREFLTVGNDVTGLDRYETLVDARDVAQGNTALLAERGTAKLIGASEAVATTENQAGNLIFGEDYFLGDLVTVRFPVPNYTYHDSYYDMSAQMLQVDQRVSEVTVSIEGGAEHIDIKYGELILTKSENMRRDLNRLMAT